jgi:HEAT repeat protein
MERHARRLPVLYDEDPSLRQDAVYALAEIGGETAIGILQQAVADHHIGVREAATDVLAELYREKEP